MLLRLAVLILIALSLTVTALMEGRDSWRGNQFRDSLSTTNRETKAAAVSKTQTQRVKPISSQAVGFSETKPLREIARQAPERVEHGKSEQGEEREAAENPPIKTPTAKALADASVRGGLVRDKALQTSIPSPNMPSPIISFEGLGSTDNINAGFGSLSPPDPNGYVGPNNYVQQDNLLVRIWDKSGNPLVAPFKLSNLFAVANGGPGGQCAATDEGDPVVLYDKFADRWILSQFGFAVSGDPIPPFHECIAVSKTGDPIGAYYAYDFVTPGSDFPDYPKLGVWPDGYYMTVNQFSPNFDGAGVYSFNRVKMLAGDATANFIYFNLNLTSFPEGIGGMLPSDLDGLTPPPASRPNTFAYFTATDFGDPANGLRLFDFHADFTTPANSTFTERAESTYNNPLPVAAFSLVTPTGRSDVPQPGSTTGLDAITDRLMHRMQYRNFGTYETLVTNHTVGAPASTTFGTFRAAPRYYELRRTGAGSFVVNEQATFAPADGISRWMGSAAEDNQGNLAIGYSVSDNTSVKPGIRYAGRLATDPAGGLAQGEATLIDGTGIQTSTGNRWGDYSGLSVDPTDDCTFWYTQEYYTSTGQSQSSVGWQTRIGTFKFSTCTAPAKGTAHFTVTNCVNNALIANASISIDGIPYGASIANGTYDGTLAPGNHSYSISKTGYSTATGNFNITNGNTTNVPVCLTGVPLMKPSGSALVSESFTPANGAVDPGETVTVNFTLRNDGAANTSSLIATLQATGGVQNPGGPQNYGAISSGGGTGTQPFTFTANSALTCGSMITATLHLQDGVTDLGNATYNFQLGTTNTTTSFSENFDGVTAPALPAGWMTTAFGNVPTLWVTSTTTPNSAPNDAFAPDRTDIADDQLFSPTLTIPAAGGQVTFKNLFNTEPSFDGMVLEIGISNVNGGMFQDIVAAGGSFVTGGYNGTILSGSNSPIANRAAWTGLSAGTTSAPAYITTVVNLPASAAGQSIKLKWRAASDESVAASGAPGVRIDDVTISTATPVCIGPLRIDSIAAPAGRTSGGQQIVLNGAFPGLSTVTMGGAAASFIYTNGGNDTSKITVTTPAHAVGAVDIVLTPTSGSTLTKTNAFAYLPTVFTDDTIMVGQTTTKAQHILELRQAVDAMRAVAGLSGAPWNDPALAAGNTIRAVHITDLRTFLDDAATRLGFATSPYTDPGLTTGFVIKRVHIEELRQRIRTIAG